MGVQKWAAAAAAGVGRGVAGPTRSRRGRAPGAQQQGAQLHPTWRAPAGKWPNVEPPKLLTVYVNPATFMRGSYTLTMLVPLSATLALTLAPDEATGAGRGHMGMRPAGPPARLGLPGVPTCAARPARTQRATPLLRSVGSVGTAGAARHSAVLLATRQLTAAVPLQASAQG